MAKKHTLTTTAGAPVRPQHADHHGASPKVKGLQPGATRTTQRPLQNSIGEKHGHKD
jgi:hypothetical protein